MDTQYPFQVFGPEMAIHGGSTRAAAGGNQTLMSDRDSDSQLKSSWVISVKVFVRGRPSACYHDTSWRVNDPVRQI